MNGQFLKDHLLDIEVVAALSIALLLRFGFDTSWLVAIVLGLSAFIFIPLLVLFGPGLVAVWYSIEYKVPANEIIIERKPADCDFWHAPMGLKDCTYERVVAAERGKSVFVSWQRRDY